MTSDRAAILDIRCHSGWWLYVVWSVDPRGAHNSSYTLRLGRFITSFPLAVLHRSPAYTPRWVNAGPTLWSVGPALTQRVVRQADPGVSIVSDRPVRNSARLSGRDIKTPINDTLFKVYPQRRPAWGLMAAPLNSGYLSRSFFQTSPPALSQNWFNVLCLLGDFSVGRVSFTWTHRE